MNRHDRRTVATLPRITKQGENPAMNAEQFENEAHMEGDEMVVTITHKFTKRSWTTRAKEEEWPEKRAALLATIEQDLTPIAEASPT